jgi:hypothetical protein
MVILEMALSPSSAPTPVATSNTPAQANWAIFILFVAFIAAPALRAASHAPQLVGKSGIL